MTTKNLNRTSTDILVQQYIKDVAADFPHPIRYILHDYRFKKDIAYEIFAKVDPDVFKRALGNYRRERGDKIEFEYEVFKASQRISGIAIRESDGKDGGD